jgi:hypothetical protein
MRERDENKLKAREIKLMICEEKTDSRGSLKISFHIFHFSECSDCGLPGILHTTSIFRVK